MIRIVRLLMAAALVTAMIVTAASAEILNLSQNRAGFFAGLNVANQGGDMEQIGNDLAAELEVEFGGTWTSSKGSNLGFGVGGYYVFQTSPTFGLELEGQYIRRGAKIDLTASGAPGLASGTGIESEFQINYFEIPLLARFSPNPAAGVRPVFLIGPVLSIKTGANLKLTIGDQSDTQSFSEGYKDLVFGVLGGAGISAQVGASSYLVVQARYYLGLSNSIDDPTLSAKSGDFGFFAGMEFTPK